VNSALILNARCQEMRQQHERPDEKKRVYEAHTNPNGL
jgi:hypothetical protein